MHVDTERGFARNHWLGIHFFVHPIPASAVAVLIINDHYLKAHYPGWITGKLSDFAGIFFFPLFLCAVYILLQNFILHRDSPSYRMRRRLVFLAVVLTDLIFILLKTSLWANGFYVAALAAIGFPSHLVRDPTDLIAVGMNVPTYLYAQHYIRRN